MIKFESDIIQKQASDIANVMATHYIIDTYYIFIKNQSVIWSGQTAQVHLPDSRVDTYVESLFLG
jgi:hypothetical protein